MRALYTHCPYCGTPTDTGYQCPYRCQPKTYSINPEPQRQPFKCPVCNGIGVLSSLYYKGVSGYPDKPCHACSGTGIVWGAE
jgi:hypothetical protein